MLQPHEAAEFYDKGMLHLRTYAYLNGASQKQQHVRGHGVENRALWQLLPKHHHMMHMCEDVRDNLINANWYTLLCAESFIGVIGRVTRTCHRASLPLRSLQRYKLLLALHFKEQR